MIEMARHEQAKGIFRMTLGSLGGVRIHLEPLVRGTARRNDIRITRSRPTGLNSVEFVVSLASQQARSTVLALEGLHEASAHLQAENVALKYLGLAAR